MTDRGRACRLRPDSSDGYESVSTEQHLQLAGQRRD